jgi:ribosomal protein S18 acetylase RimI-like enzyme
MEALFSGDGFTVRPVGRADVRSTLRVYRQCEDFLSLGPVAKASRSMVLADIGHSAKTHGRYCGIWNDDGAQVGVLDFVAARDAGTAFVSLLMICRPHRRRGLGTAVLAALETYLAAKCGSRVLDSGVQVNNRAAIAFWEARGFRIDRRPRPQEDGTTTFAMSKSLGGSTRPATPP